MAGGRMEKILYLEGASGISGDMTVGALLDLGANEDGLRAALASLPLSGFQIEIARVIKSGLDCCDFRVRLEPEFENRDHDMAYLHGEPGNSSVSEAGHEHADHEHADHEHTDHEHTDHEHHTHEHSHAHDHGGEHHHLHRGLQEVNEILDGAKLDPEVRALAGRIFQILAEAEAKAHGTKVDKVHFHEVGAVDSIVDIVAAAYCLTDLGIREVAVPGIAEGHGMVRCAHGWLPVPVPAVVNIAAAEGLILKLVDTEGELVTPTGAAIAAAVKTRDRLPGKFRIVKTGMGAGKRSYSRPSILRAMILEEAEEIPGEAEKDAGRQIVKLETDIDDCSGEILGYTLERLMKAGAREAHYIPVMMKKNRPGYQLEVICTEDTRQALEEIIFRETTTIGIRRTLMDRTVLSRRLEAVNTPFGEARIKVCRIGDTEKAYPEYEDAARIAKEQGLTLAEAMNVIIREK